MARNRVIYQSEGVFISQFAGSTGVSEHAQLARIQSSNYAFSIDRIDVNQYGDLAKIGSLSLGAPQVSFDSSYLLTDGYNELALNLGVGTGEQSDFLNGILSDDDGVNIYILTSQEGVDLNQSSGLYSYIAIGNAFLDRYTLSLSVGSIPTVSTVFSAYNIIGGTMTGQQLATNPSYDIFGEINYNTVKLPDASPLTGETLTAIKNKDLEFYINGGSGSISKIDFDTGIHIQSFELDIDLTKDVIYEVGRHSPVVKKPQTPLLSSISINANLAEIQAVNLVDIIDSSDTYNITLVCKNEDVPVFRIDFEKAKLEGENFASSVGSSNKTVDLVFSTQIGNTILASGSRQSGIYSNQAFLVQGGGELIDSGGSMFLVPVS